LMLYEWNSDDPSGMWKTENCHQEAILLAHPDHLRRVMWTARTILQSQQSHQLRGKEQPCTIKGRETLLLRTAIEPYSLEWPVSIADTTTTSSQVINLFDSVSTTVHTNGKELVKSWYDDNLGFFPDGFPQKWTHRREVWLLYDQWAVAKGIVTGTIDADVSFS